MPTVFRITLQRAGNTLGVTLPTRMVDDLQLAVGEEMLVMEADEGIFLSPAGSAFKQAYDDYQRLGRQYQTALEGLDRSSPADVWRGNGHTNGHTNTNGNDHGIENGSGNGRLRS